MVLNNITLIGGGTIYHTIGLAEKLNLKYIINKKTKLRSGKCFILLGVTKGWIKKLEKLKDTNIIFWWIGTDVLSCKGVNIPKNIKHICESELLRQELKENYNIDAKIITIAPDSYPIFPLPYYPAILSYIPDRREDFFRYSWIVQLAKDFPNLPFHIYGRKDMLPGEVPPNIYNHGWVSGIEKLRLYLNTSIYLRLPKHDAFSQSMMEMIQCGRRVIHTIPHPYCIIIRNYEELKENLSKLITITDPYYKASKYYQENFTIEKMKEKLEDFIKGM